MAYKQLWILVEGADDSRFFEILKPAIAKFYNYVKTYEWAGIPSEKIKNFIKSLNSMPDAGYYFITDINSSPCITDRKDAKKKTKNYGIILDESRIIVVIKEIESWYLAGLDDESSKELGIKTLPRTDNITKEIFNKMIPKRFIDSRIDFMQELRKYYSIETALTKNSSFRYFMERIQKDQQGQKNKV